MSLERVRQPLTRHATLLAYLDVGVLVVVAAPIMLLIGVSAAGLPGRRRRLDRSARGRRRRSTASPSLNDPRGEVTLRLGYLLGRLFLLAIAVILVRNGRVATTA